MVNPIEHGGFYGGIVNHILKDDFYSVKIQEYSPKLSRRERNSPIIKRLYHFEELSFPKKRSEEEDHPCAY